MVSNDTRETATARLKGQKASRSKSKKKDQNVQRRKVGKRLLNIQMGKDSQSTRRHISGIVDPTENCRTTVEKAEVILADISGDENLAPKRKVSKKGKKKSSSSPRKCSNCGAVDHSKKSCHEPKHAFESEAKKRRRLGVEREPHYH
jgi:CelD/BcsL family acetyltransferase involved in cellulose biosynthesis